VCEESPNLLAAVFCSRDLDTDLLTLKLEGDLYIPKTYLHIENEVAIVQAIVNVLPELKKNTKIILNDYMDYAETNIVFKVRGQRLSQMSPTFDHI